MLKVDGLKISITRGDTGSITVNFTGEDTPENGTIAKVALQKLIGSNDSIWEKNLTIHDSQVRIPFFTEDTDYPFGVYYWCLRLLYENGDVYTPMDKPQEFRILPVAGDATGGDADGG